MMKLQPSPSMLKTPEQFQPLLRAHDSPAGVRSTFIFRGDELLLHAETLALPDAGAIAGLSLQENRIHPMGLHEERYYCAAWVDKHVEAPAGHQFSKLRPLFEAVPGDFLGLAGRAFQIVEWARTHRFCGNCGTPTVFAEGERCVKCPECGTIAYPRISPAMMVLIKKGEHILLAKHVASPTSRYVPLAGFLEAGESIEEAVHREVFEEVGLKITNLQYFGSQSWPFPHSLMIAFTADYASGEITIDKNEIADAQWFGPGNPIPEYPIGVSVSGALVDAHRPRPQSPS
jgi:NAD+ diphosphatase